MAGPFKGSRKGRDDRDHGHGDHDHDDDDHDGGHHGDCRHEHHHSDPCSPVVRCRDIYLKIEKLPAYTPVAPDEDEHDGYRIDCMRNVDHEDGTIPTSEVERRRLEAVVYREYLDANYTTLKADPLIATDINEPRAERRIPGTVIYASPGERLFVHVCNADDQPHSLHVHGLIYGVDSDGSWPFGVQDASGAAQRRDLPRADVVLRLRRQRGHNRRVAVPRPPHAHRGAGRAGPVRRHRRA